MPVALVFVIVALPPGLAWGAEGPLFAAPYLTFDTGGHPASVAIADLNADGAGDLVAANSIPSTVSVMLGDGSGMFGAWTEYPVGMVPVFVKTGDLNGDGALDLVVANRDDHTVSVLLGHGDGTFAPRTDFATWAGPVAVALGDLNADGQPDLAVAASGSYPDYAGKVSVLLGGGSGAFAPHVDYATGSGSVWVEIGDLDEDGAPDLVVTDWYSYTLSTLRGHGDGTFATARTDPTVSFPSSVVIGYLDGDSHLDLAVAIYGATDRVEIHHGNGNGTFTPIAYHETGHRPHSLTAADLNLDGRLDLSVTNYFSGGVTVLMDRGNGTFARAGEALTPDSPIALAVGDLNGDGIPDLATAHGNFPDVVAVHFGSGDGTFGTDRPIYLQGPPLSVAIGSLNGDAMPDLVVCVENPDNDYSHGWVARFAGTGGGSFGPRVDHQTPYTPTDVVIHDLNGDGWQDLAVANGGEGLVSVMLGSGDGTFGPRLDSGPRLGAADLGVGDLNRDGRPDLVVARNGPSPYSFGVVSVLLGAGDGTFGQPSDFQTARGPHALAVGDLNHDGNLDVATADYGYGVGSDSVSVLVGNGDGTLQHPTDYQVGRYPKSVAIGDVSGDGVPDLVAANSDAQSISVLHGIGDGTFGPRTDYGTSYSPVFVLVNDVDGDGRMDVITADQGAHSVSIRLGRPDGTLGPRTGYGTGREPRTVACGDLDGDGLQDLVVANQDWYTLSVLLNRPADAPTTTVLTRFDAVWAGTSVEIRWQFGWDSDVASTAVERGNGVAGPWTTLDGSPRQDGMVEVLTDVEVEPGHDYFYRLIATLRRGGAVTFGPVSTAGAPPASEFAFTSIGPSPGDGPMRIAFAAGHEARVRLAVHDVLGRVVEVLVDGTVPAGRHDAVWEGTSVPAGLYFLRLEWPGGAATRRVALTR